MPGTTVREIMTTDVVHLPTDTPLERAAQVMRDRGIGNVVVADGERLVGLVTDRDIVVRAVATGADPHDATIGSVVTQGPVVVRPEDSAQSAAVLMRDRAIRRVLVCDDGGLVGILSIGDLARTIDPESVLGGISHAAPNN
jgi:CBS domain-containing protein